MSHHHTALSGPHLQSVPMITVVEPWPTRVFTYMFLSWSSKL
jgi:hypothetical protein